MKDGVSLVSNDFDKTPPHQVAGRYFGARKARCPGSLSVSIKYLQLIDGPNQV